MTGSSNLESSYCNVGSTVCTLSFVISLMSACFLHYTDQSCEDGPSVLGNLHSFVLLLHGESLSMGFFFFFFLNVILLAFEKKKWPVTVEGALFFSHVARADDEKEQGGRLRLTPRQQNHLLFTLSSALSVSLSLSLSLSLSVSVSLCLSLSLSFSLCMSLSFPLALSLYVSVSLSLSLSLFLHFIA